MTINEILKYSINKLKQKDIEEAILKSKLLVANILKCSKEYLLINGEQGLSNNEIEKINTGIEQLIKGVPIQYITNKQEFMGLEFFVNENVLIPQPDTEILVEESLELLRKIDNARVLDLCTGSGAIAVSIQKKADVQKIIASDISLKALEVAKINCEKHNLKEIILKQSDLFENINEKFDLIVSNPPYIKTETILKLDKEVQKEPLIALDGGQDGLDFYRKIIDNAHKYLTNNGYLCLEIGYDQKDAIIEIIKLSEKYNQIYSKKDLNKNDRIIVCRRK